MKKASDLSGIKFFTPDDVFTRKPEEEMSAFADKLKELREKATPGDYAANGNYVTFVMSRAADIEALVRAVGELRELKAIPVNNRDFNRMPTHIQIQLCECFNALAALEKK